MITDTQRQKTREFIASSSDPSDLRTVMENALKSGERDIAEFALQRLAYILPAERVGTVEHDFWVCIHATEELMAQKRGKTVRLSRTRQKVGRVGVNQCLIDWALFPIGQETEGFRMLLDWNMPEMTGEAIVLRHPSSFDKHVLDAARNRLKHAGVDVDAILARAGVPGA